MPTSTYDFTPTTINGQLITVDRLANSPVMIYRALRTLVQQRLIGDLILTGRVDLTGTGSGVYEISEQIFPDFLASRISPLGEYPLTTFTPGSIAQVKPDKWGEAFDIADENIAHNRMDIVKRDLLKVGNRLIFNADSLTLAAVASAVTQTFTATTPWATRATANPLGDVLDAAAIIDSLNMGYVADTVVLTPTLYAKAISASSVLSNTAREGSANITLTGKMQQIGGLTYLKSTNLPAGVSGIVLDSTVLGSQAYENLAGGYQGQAGSLESKQFRKESVDGVHVQARMVRAPMVQEPGAAVKLVSI